MNEEIFKNISEEIDLALFNVCMEPKNSRIVYDKISELLFEKFNVTLMTISPYNYTTEKLSLNDARKTIVDEITAKFAKANMFSLWEFNENKACLALNKLIYDIIIEVDYKCPKKVMIFHSPPDEKEFYHKKVFGDIKYGMYVKIIQSDKSEKIFDLIDYYTAI